MTNSKGGFTLSKTNKKLLKETHLNTVLMESYKPEDKTVEGSPVIASFKINVTTENLENHNGRVYSTEVWNQPYALQRGGKYLDESGKLRPLSLLGNLDHPKDNHGEVYLSEAGLAWYQLDKQGSDWLGEAHVLDTPQGKIIKTFLEYAKQFGGGDQIGVSTRALGDAIMVESANGPVEEIVPEGFELVSVDFVYSPSSIYSNTPLMESKHRNKNILVESIQGLRAQDLEHKEIYDTVLKELDPEIQEIKKGLEHMDINKLFEATKAVKFSHAVIEFIEGGPNYDTPTQKILRNHRNSGTKFTDLDKLFDLVYKADQEYDTEQGGYDKCYIDFYGSVGGDAIKLLHIRYDIGDKLGREEYPMNKDLDELEDIMIDKVWNTYKTTQGLKENKFVKSETVTINKAKADYLKQLKDTEYKLHHAIYTIDNMSDDEYKQTKYFVDTPERQKFLNKLKKEHDAVVAEINAAESLTENKTKTERTSKTSYRDRALNYLKKRGFGYGFYGKDDPRELERATNFLTLLFAVEDKLNTEVWFNQYNISEGWFILTDKGFTEESNKEALALWNNYKKELQALAKSLHGFIELEQQGGSQYIVLDVDYTTPIKENKGDKMDKTKDELKETKVVLEADETEDTEETQELDKDETELETDVENPEETEEEIEDEEIEEEIEEETTEETDSEKLDRALLMLDELLARFNDLFIPLEPLELEDGFSDLDDEYSDEEITDFSDEDIDSMTEEELLSLEELLELE